MNLPVDAECGDNLDYAYYYLGKLIDSAAENGLDHDEFFYIDDHMLIFFMRLQGNLHMKEFIHDCRFSRLEVAHEVWRCAPPCMVEALIRANLPKIIPEGRI
jgi:hypothetical protein